MPESTSGVTTRASGAEAAGELERDGQVRAGGRTRPEAFLRCSATRHRKRVGGRDCMYLVEIRRLEQRRPEPDAATFDPVRPGLAARQDSRLGRLDPDTQDVGQRCAQLTRDAEEAARRADIRAERVDPTIELLEQLAPELCVAVDHVAVVELVGREAAGLVDDLPGSLHHPREQLWRDALRARDRRRAARRRPRSCAASRARTRRT